MSWSNWFSGKPPAAEPRPSVQDVTFDSRLLRADRKTGDAMTWWDLDNDRLIARVDRGAGPWSLDTLRAHFRDSAGARGGGIVSVTFGRANGIQIAKAITKFEDMPAYLYEGTVMVPFRDAAFRLTLEASERGTTGVREAVAMALLLEVGEMAIPTVRPPAGGASMRDWTRDPYDDAYTGPTLHSLSDDERLDEIFPQHPLTKIRRWFTSMEQTLSVAADLRHEVLEDATSGAEAPRHRMPPLALGHLFLKSGRFDLAEPLFLEALPLRDHEPVLDAPRAGQILTLLGLTRESLGRLEDAVWAHASAVRAFAATSDGTDLSAIRARANLARVYAGLGRADDAEPLLSEVLPILEAPGTVSEHAVAVNALGLVRQLQGRHAEALACFERAHAGFVQAHGPDFVDCATTLRNAARSAEALGDQVRSRQALAQADRILRKQQ
jgi:hypothetical protein